MGKKTKNKEENKKEAEVAKNEFDPLSIESKKVATVVLMLSSPEEEVLTKACEAIYRYSEKGDDNKSFLKDQGAVEPLTRLLTYEDKGVCRYALMALGVMASNNEVKRLLKTLGIIPVIINKLAPEEDTVVHEFATLCLASLSVDFTCKAQISEQDGLQPLVNLLSSPDPDVKKNSVECIYHLVQDCSNRVVVRELNGLLPILELLSSEFPVIQQLALRVLESISSTDTETRTALREEQGFTILLELLAAIEFSDLHAEVLRIVSNCLEDPESVQVIQRDGGLDKLLQFLNAPNSPEIQSSAVKALSRAAQSRENRNVLQEHEIEKSLISLLPVENTEVSIAVCQAVAAMSNNLRSKDTFGQLDGIRLIVQLLSTDDKGTKEAAAEALSCLTSANLENAYAVYEEEGDKLLVELLQDVSSSTVVHAAAVLCNMAPLEVLRKNIVSHGAMEALVEPLQSGDERVLISTAKAVAALACDADSRTRLRNAGALPMLVNLLKSSNTEVRRNACWAISVCANDDPTITDLCWLGALEILEDINFSLNRKNKFSEVALHKLLNSNLPVKYSLTGRLSFTDITTDGFYDPGKVREGHRVPALENVAKEVMNQYRAVIAVNGTLPDQLTSEPGEEQQQESPPESRSSSVTSNKTESEVEVSEQHEEEEQEKAVEVELWVLPDDAAFHDLIAEANKSVMSVEDEVEMYSALAKLVCDAMGGPVDADKLHEFLWELHLSELKFQLQSNVVPIGMIRKGTFYHRALLFKALADRMGLSCSLVRGEYSRGWNEVLISPQKVTGFYFHPESYIIDLMHKPGNLLKSGTPPAILYQTI